AVDAQSPGARGRPLRADRRQSAGGWRRRRSMTASERALRIALVAPGSASDEELTLAGAIGRLLAERRCTLVCGGLGGAMAAARRGAKEAGGVTARISPPFT